MTGWLQVGCWAGVLSLLVTGCGNLLPPGPVEVSRSRATSALATLHLDRSVLQTRELPPVVVQGAGEFDNALALNVPYRPIVELRQQLQAMLDRPLTFFKAWNPDGEAHVTVLTPVEFNRMKSGMPAGLAPFSMQQIGELAASKGLQEADLTVLGLGSGRAALEGRMEETYFVIVESRALRALRRAIHVSYVARGGDPAAFDPADFYPHVTVGFTRRDLHQQDGVLKDLRHSQDTRFRLQVR